MRVRKILYHGTTMLRLDMIKKDGLLRCNMPKSFEIEESFDINKGYVYLSSRLDEAIMYGLIKSLLDTRSDDLEKRMKSNPNYRDPVVLGINAFKLGDNVEIDPQDPQTNPLLNEEFKTDQYYKNSQWYRCKGDIKLKHLYKCKQIPFNVFGDDVINGFMESTEKMYNESKSMMNTLASRPILKQICRSML